MLYSAASTVLASQKYESAFLQKLVFGLSMPKYMFMTDSAKLDSLPYYRQPTLEHAQSIWNMGEQGALKEFSKLFYPKIETNRHIWIPSDGEINNDTNIFEEKVNTIQVRILHSSKLNFYENQNQKESKRCPKNIDKALIYIHGGGFIALSSESPQSFTRRWSNELDIPIFCIDYRQPPEHRFPGPVYDCFNAYKFIMNHIHKFMNIRPSKMFITGDSCGGNLACATTALLMKSKLPPPSGLYLIMPSVDIRQTFAESSINSITDVFLWPSCLQLCLKEYLDNDYTKA